MNYATGAGGGKQRPPTEDAAAKKPAPAKKTK